MSVSVRRASDFSDAELAGILLAVDPAGLRGAVLRAGPGPVRDQWLAAVRRLCGSARPFRKIPAAIGEERLIGGLDFAASLAAGRPLFAKGVLAESHGGTVEVAMAERLAPSVTGILCAALDARMVRVERDGFTRRSPADFLLIACDEGIDDEIVDPGLADRLALHVEFAGGGWPRLEFAGIGPDEVVRLRKDAAGVTVATGMCETLAGTALALGIESLRADFYAVRAARVLAALNGRHTVEEEDAALAARLVFPHRATRFPAPPEEQASPPPPADSSSTSEEHEEASEQAVPDDVVLESVRAALPEKLLELSADRMRSRGESRGRGRGGALRRRRQSGRPVGSVPEDQAPNGRINLLATLKAAAPWQSLRRGSTAAPAGGRADTRLLFERGDLRVTRYKDRTETTTVFVVDASGSQAAQRLGEVKGAIELLLADCYVRRDEVALVMFRQADATVQLPPTRALARARKVLADIPAGGGTPLAAGIRKAAELVATVRRQGRTPVVVFLTDGRANVALDGSGGAGQAQEDAERAAREFRTLGLRPILVDSSRRPRRIAETLATTMGAAYLPMPYADARSLSAVIGAGRAA